MPGPCQPEPARAGRQRCCAGSAGPARRLSGAVPVRSPRRAGRSRWTAAVVRPCVPDGLRRRASSAARAGVGCQRRRGGRARPDAPTPIGFAAVLHEHAPSARRTDAGTVPVTANATSKMLGTTLRSVPRVSRLSASVVGVQSAPIGPPSRSAISRWPSRSPRCTAATRSAASRPTQTPTS